MKRRTYRLEFRKTTEFPRGTLYSQLVDVYSFNDECKKHGILCRNNIGKWNLKEPIKCSEEIQHELEKIC